MLSEAKCLLLSNGEADSSLALRMTGSKLFAGKNKKLRYCNADLLFKSAAFPITQEKSRGVTEQLRFNEVTVRNMVGFTTAVATVNRILINRGLLLPRPKAHGQKGAVRGYLCK